MGSEILVRSATTQDRKELANLIHFEVFVHRHMEWQPPLDWIGKKPFLIAELNNQIIAALACPPDVPSVAWIRLFASSSMLELKDTWQLLWESALDILWENQDIKSVAAMPLHEWLISLLIDHGFHLSYQVVLLTWETGEIPNGTTKIPLKIRPMLHEDLISVHEVDHDSFVPVWQNSFTSLELAYSQAAVATVAEIENKILGYQISTATQLGGHLARLAIHPSVQRKGVGFALVRDLLTHFKNRGAHSVTVNTQKDNVPSRMLYQKLGFISTGEEYPIFELSLDKP